MQDQVSFLGFGEAAQAFVGDSRWNGRVLAYDCKTNVAATRDAKLGEYAAFKATGALTSAEAISSASYILSLVTADQAVQAATEAGHNLAQGALFFDMNSIAPVAKRAAAERIEEAGGRYIDVAIMAPVHPAQLTVPLLISSPHHASAQAALRTFGFSNVVIAGDEVGRASTIKMVRSVFVKGVEALSSECILAAAAAGVTDEVLNSLGEGWTESVNYNLERMLVHGHRRAAEMEQVCITLQGLGIAPLMTSGTTQRQRELGDLGFSSVPETLSDKLAAIREANQTATAT